MTCQSQAIFAIIAESQSFVTLIKCHFFTPLVLQTNAVLVYYHIVVHIRREGHDPEQHHLITSQ